MVVAVAAVAAMAAEDVGSEARLGKSVMAKPVAAMVVSVVSVAAVASVAAVISVVAVLAVVAVAALLVVPGEAAVPTVVVGRGATSRCD